MDTEISMIISFVQNTCQNNRKNMKSGQNSKIDKCD